MFRSSQHASSSAERGFGTDEAAHATSSGPEDRVGGSGNRVRPVGTMQNMRFIARDMFNPRMPSLGRRDKSKKSRFRRTPWWTLTDKSTLAMFLLFTGGLVTVIVFALHEPLPNRYICERYPCEDAFGTYYTQVEQEKLPAGSPCLIFPQPYAALCPRYETFYYEVMQSGAVSMYVAASLIALGGSIVVQLLYVVATEFITEVTHAVVGLTLWAAMGVAIYAGSYWAILWGILALLQNLYASWTRERMDDAVTVMTFAFRFFHERRDLQILSYTLVIIQAGLFVAFIIFFVTLNGRYGGVCDAFTIIAYLWVNQSIRMIGQVVSAGVFGKWYFRANSVTGKNGGQLSTWRVLAVTLLKHFGSVCFAAVVMALIKISRVVYGLFRTATGAGAAIFVVLALLADAVLSSLNHYGLCRIIIYGDSFWKSSKDGFLLLSESGIQEMMLDDVIIVLNTVVALASAAGACLVAWLMIQFGVSGVENSKEVNTLTVVYLPCFIIGFTVGCPVLDTLESVVMSLYMCFAEEPQTLEESDLELYTDLLDSWFDVQEDDDEEDVDSDVSYSDDEDAETDDDESQDGGDDAVPSARQQNTAPTMR